MLVFPQGNPADQTKTMTDYQYDPDFPRIRLDDVNLDYEAETQLDVDEFRLDFSLHMKVVGYYWPNGKPGELVESHPGAPYIEIVDDMDEDNLLAEEYILDHNTRSQKDNDRLAADWFYNWTEQEDETKEGWVQYAVGRHEQQDEEDRLNYEPPEVYGYMDY